jgi:hypothetical protein
MPEDVSTLVDDRFFDISIDLLCMYCKSIRDDENYWQTVETYISHHTHARFSHSICPKCLERIRGAWLDDTNDGSDAG